MWIPNFYSQILKNIDNSGGQSIPTFSDRLPDLGSYSPITYKILQKVSDRYEEFSSCPSKPPFWGKNENFSIFCPKRSFMLKDTNMIKQVITIGTKLSFKLVVYFFNIIKLQWSGSRDGLQRFTTSPKWTNKWPKQFSRL